MHINIAILHIIFSVIYLCWPHPLCPLVCPCWAAGVCGLHYPSLVSNPLPHWLSDFKSQFKFSVRTTLSYTFFLKKGAKEEFFELDEFSSCTTMIKYSQNTHFYLFSAVVLSCWQIWLFTGEWVRELSTTMRQHYLQTRKTMVNMADHEHRTHELEWHGQDYATEF